MNLIDRLKYLMKLNNLTSSAFADEIGVQRSSISHILSGRNKPSLEFITKILTRYPKVSADWLISGNTKTSDTNINTTKTEEKEEKESITPKTNHPSTPTESVLKAEKQIKKVMIFYTDNTFEEIMKC